LLLHKEVVMRTARPGIGVFVVTLASLCVLLSVFSVSAFGQALYGCDREGRMFTIDIATGAGTFECELPTYPDPGATEIEYEEGGIRAYVQARDGFFAAQVFDVFRCNALGTPVNNSAAYNGLEFVAGVLYGTSIPYSCEPSDFRILHPRTGTSTLIGPTGLGPISGLAWDVATGTMYGITGCADDGLSDLVTIDMATGAATIVGPTGVTAGSLEFGPDGQLYAGGNNRDGGNLYRISTLDGSATLVGPTGFGSVTGLTFVNTTLVLVEMDIRPESCPNPLNVAKPGVVPVALLGGADFDVNDVDVSSLRLEGVPPLRTSVEDVTTPGDPDDCECTAEGPDGLADITLKFSKWEIAEALGTFFDGEVVEMTLTGKLLDGTLIEGKDCVKIIFNGRVAPERGVTGVVLGGAMPNPFNPVTRISYSIPEGQHVRLVVYDVAGRLVEELADEAKGAGEYVVEWDAGRFPSGIYFYRLSAGNATLTKKMVFLK
jgi:hypothetical protein